MVRLRHATPEGHGEVLTEPVFEEWAELADKNSALVAAWDFSVGGVAAAALRRQARRESVAEAGAYSRRMGVSTAETPAEPALVIVTGHQPELYHPGIWVKDFLLQRLADEVGAAGIDLVVDTDAADPVALHTPCMCPSPDRCTTILTTPEAGACYACSAPPSSVEVEAFREMGQRALATLPAPALGRHFAAFCDALGESIDHADDLAQALTGARRRFEAVAGTDYLELGVSRQAGTAAFRRFAAALVLDAERFAAVYNQELEAYRVRTRTRSKAQPFPNLRVDDESVELPFWVLSQGRRSPARVTTSGEPLLLADQDPVCVLPREVDEVANALAAVDALLVPRAATLTLFNRMFVADLFIHGVGGGRYDRLTDALIRSYYGVEPPRFAVASMTLFLPLGAHVVTDEEIASLEQRLKRLEHNPDQFMDDVEFDDPAQRAQAEQLVAEKSALIVEIAQPGADKKSVGERIRLANGRLATIMAPLVTETRAQLDAAIAGRDSAEVLSDRTYPYCLWSPLEVMDKVR